MNGTPQFSEVSFMDDRMREMIYRSPRDLGIVVLAFDTSCAISIAYGKAGGPINRLVSKETASIEEAIAYIRKTLESIPEYVCASGQVIGDRPVFDEFFVEDIMALLEQGSMNVDAEEIYSRLIQGRGLASSFVSNPAAFLRNYGIAFSSGWQRPHKGIADLRDEIANRECSLVVLNGRVVRRTYTAAVDVLSPDGCLVLVEEREYPIDSSIGGKVSTGESFEMAARREIREELGIETFVELMLRPGYRMKIRDPHTTYPGIASHNACRYFEARLSDDQFRPEGYVEEKDGRRREFVWKEIPRS